MGTGLREGDPGHITFAWYPALRRDDLGIGPSRVWWVGDLEARDPAQTLAEIDARSLARPDPTITTDLDGGLTGLDHLVAGLVAEQTWKVGQRPPRHAALELRLRNTASL